MRADYESRHPPCRLADTNDSPYWLASCIHVILECARGTSATGSQTKGKTMTKAKTVKQDKTVIVRIPAVNKAWNAFCDVSETNEIENVKALKVLASVIKNQQADATSVAKSIEATGKTSSVIGYGSVKALPTWFALNAKHKELRAMKLAKQITFSTKCYSLLGKGEAEKVTTWSDLENMANDAQAEKTRKAKEAKASPTKESKKPVTLKATLQSVLALVEAIEAEAVGDDEIDLINTISAVLESKMRLDA